MVKKQKGGMHVVAWCEKKRKVCVLSTANNIDNTEITRPGKRGQPAQTYPKPVAIQQYTDHFNAVDKNDQMRSYYGIANKARKFWKYIFWFIVDVSMINAFVLYKEARGGPRPKPMTHLEFHLEMFLAYLCDNFGHCQTVMRLLVNTLYIPGELQSSVQKLAETRTHYLFEPEENTFFSERIHQQLDIYKALMKMQIKIDGLSLVPDLLQELRKAIPVLRSCSADQLVYNPCGESGMLAALAGMGMLLHLASRPTSPQQDSHPHDERYQGMSSEIPAELSNLLQLNT
ncbi:hypothetical protein ACOMHN_042571 [Nucella lapillus]